MRRASIKIHSPQTWTTGRENQVSVNVSFCAAQTWRCVQHREIPQKVHVLTYNDVQILINKKIYLLGLKHGPV